MSITVVTVRDDSGAPSTREVYASGDRYTTTQGNLEILSAEPRLLGMYPSGNWLSAYRDDCVEVVSGMPLDSGAGSSSGVGSAEDILDSDSDSDSDTDVGVALDSGSASYPDTDATDLYPTADVEAGVDTDRAQSDADRKAGPDPSKSDSDSEVKPDRERPGSGERVRDEPTVSPAPAASSPRLQPVAFKAITVRVTRREIDNGPGKSRLRPVAFGPRVLNAARSEDAPAEPRSRLRPVVFRQKTYRDARPQPGPTAADETQRDGGEADGGPETSAQ